MATTQVTIEEVAREAGVSRSTASLVLRGGSPASQKTRDRVQAAATRLGYRVNLLAAGLRSNRSYMIGLVVSDLTYPHHARIAIGVEEAVEDDGYRLLVANSRGSAEREQQQIDGLRQHRADGLLITPREVDRAGAAHLESLAAQGYPVITLYREVPNLAVDFCGVDAYATVRQLVDYLVRDLGHRRIGLLGGQHGRPISEQRYRAWHDALSAHGLTPDDALVVSGGGGRADGERATIELLGRKVSFTALVCGNDFTAVGALRALHLAGRRVPEECSVAGIGGFEDIRPPDMTLTTMVYDFEGIGRYAGTLLRERIAGGSPGHLERHVIPACLRAGDTTAPL